MIRWLLLLAAAPVLLAQAEYFPLERGNVWIFRSGAETRTYEITGFRFVGEWLYFELNGETLLRFTAGGKLVSLRDGSETVWADFGAQEGERYRTYITPCNQEAALESRSTKYSGPVGAFDNALHITYSGGTCADGGLIEEFYLPWVGPVRRVEQTIAGPRTFDLIYSRLGGITVISSSEVAFGLTLDKPVYFIDRMPGPGTNPVPSLVARISLRHTQPEPLPVTFRSGQTYELVLRNKSREVVYRWSEGKAFTQALRTVEFPPGEKNWAVPVSLAGQDGEPFPPGRYIAEAWLVTTGGKTYTASVGFEIRHVF